MPPPASGVPPLTDDEKMTIARWIDLGAPYDKPLFDKVAAAKKPMVVTDKDRQYWAFQPLTKPTPPTAPKLGAPDNVK